MRFHHWIGCRNAHLQGGMSSSHQDNLRVPRTLRAAWRSAALRDLFSYIFICFVYSTGPARSRDVHVTYSIPLPIFFQIIFTVDIYALQVDLEQLFIQWLWSKCTPTRRSSSLCPLHSVSACWTSRLSLGEWWEYKSVIYEKDDFMIQTLWIVAVLLWIPNTLSTVRISDWVIGWISLFADKLLSSVFVRPRSRSRNDARLLASLRAGFARKTISSGRSVDRVFTFFIRCIPISMLKFRHQKR